VRCTCGGDAGKLSFLADLKEFREGFIFQVQIRIYSRRSFGLVFAIGRAHQQWRFCGSYAAHDGGRRAAFSGGYAALRFGRLAVFRPLLHLLVEW
jgi:hypothetical protein